MLRYALFILAAAIACASEPHALAISSIIQQRHLPYGTVLDPVFASRASTSIVGYSRCGDSAIWTGHYLAAESFRYNVTRSAAALQNAKAAIDGIRSLVDVTGTDLLARCLVPVSSPYAQGIASEERHHGVYTGAIGTNIYSWIGNTSRDQYSGVFFGLGVAYSMIDDAAVRASISELATRLLSFLLNKGWSVSMPDGKISTTFIVRPDQQLSLLQVGRLVNRARFDSTYRTYRALQAGSVTIPIWIELLDDHSSYFKFNLDEINLYNLIRLEDNSSYAGLYRNAYDLLRRTTNDHRNAHFNMIDRALNGASAARDEETRILLDEWLDRPRRDNFVDLRGTHELCRSPDKACSPIAVPERVRTDFLWQRSPFLLYGGGEGRIETAGIDYILPYWMARHYGTISGVNEPPSVVAGKAVSDTFAAQAIQVDVADPNGNPDVQLVLIVVNSTLSAASSCYLHYNRPSNVIYLANDLGTGWSQPAILGSSTVLQNSQCALNVAASARAGNGRGLKLTLSLSFKRSGAKNLWVYAQDLPGASTGWQQKRD